MNLKLDDNGNVVLQDGNPVYVSEDGSENAIDVAGLTATVARLNSENQKRRQQNNELAESLKAFEGLDAEAARNALDTVSKLDQQKLVDAGKVDEVRSQVAQSYQAKLDEADGRVKALESKLYDEVIGGAFARSAYIPEHLSIPADLVQAFFGKHFGMEEGSVVAKDSNGNPIYSRKNAGELASFDEALTILVEQYPNKNAILKSTGASGSGAKGSNQGSGAKPLSEMTEAERVAWFRRDPEGFKTASANLRGI